MDGETMIGLLLVAVVVLAVVGGVARARVVRR
jgi:hypothetical protein